MVVGTTRDGGQSWSFSTFDSGTAATAYADPMVAFHPDGSLLLSGLAYNVAITPAGPVAQGFSIFVARSMDGRGFQTMVLAEDAGVATQTPLGARHGALRGPDFPRLHVAPDGQVLLTWRDLVAAHPAQPERSEARFSIHDGSWSGQGGWSAPQAMGIGAPSAVVAQAVHRDVWHGVHESWHGGSLAEAQGYALQIASQDGPRWSSRLVTDDLTMGVPALALAGEDLVAVYEREGDLMMGGDVSGQRIGAGMFPTLAHAGGRVYMTSFAPAGAGRHVVEARVLAGGRWAGPQPLGEVSGRPEELGEYFGLGAVDGMAFAVWTDGTTLWGSDFRLATGAA